MGEFYDKQCPGGVQLGRCRCVCALLVSLGPDWLDASPMLHQGLSFSIVK